MPAEEKEARLRETQCQQVVGRFLQYGCVAFSGEDRVPFHPGLGRRKMGDRLPRYRESVDWSNRLPDRRKSVRALRQHTDRGANGLRALEFWMTGTDVAKVGDGIADRAKEVIEGQGSRFHGEGILHASEIGNLMRAPAFFAGAPVVEDP